MAIVFDWTRSFFSSEILELSFVEIKMTFWAMLAFCLIATILGSLAALFPQLFARGA